VEYERAVTKTQIYSYASELLIAEKRECLQQRKKFWNIDAILDYRRTL
jgi:hypothetical protein